MRLLEQLAELVAERTEALFGLIGDANLFFVDCYRSRGGRYVPALHEANAVMMAFGYARASGEIGVATVTHGPGLTNTITPLVEGVKSGVPMVLIAGDTADSWDYHQQDVDQRELVAAAGAGFVRVRTPATLAVDMGTAFRQARVESRPVVLNVPVDLMWEEVEPVAPSSRIWDAPAPRQPDADQLDAALGVIASAERPVVLAGGGARDARESLVALAAVLGAPLATSVQGNNLFHGEPANMGVFGTLATTAAQAVIAAADCIVVFGASLNKYTTADGDLTDSKAVVQIDRDDRAIGRYRGVTEAVVGDAGAVADAMVATLQDADHVARPFAARAQEMLAAGSEPRADVGTFETVDIDLALRRLDAALPQDRSVAVDVGLFEIPAFRNVHAPDSRSWVSAGAGFAAIGLGMGTAIGVAVARPDRPTILVSGDGGMLLGNTSEFRTAVEEQLDLICLVCNDGAYGAEHVQFRGRSMDPALSLLPRPDFARVAEALGGQGVTVRNSADLEKAISAIERRTGPLLIDLRCDPRFTPVE